MSGSYLLNKRLSNKDKNTITIEKNDGIGGYSNNYMINGAHKECHPDFVATPIGNDPNGFLICKRKLNQDNIPFEAVRDRDPPPTNGKMFYQTYDLYSWKPNGEPRNTYLGGNPNNIQDRRWPYQSHLQGNDYYRDCTKFRAIGIEKLDQFPGDFKYEENKWYYSAPPPVYDVRHGVQPYQLWRREQIRMGNFSEKEMAEFEKHHKFNVKNSVW